MSELQKLQQEIEALKAKLAKVGKPSKDVQKLSQWLEDTQNELADYRELSWLDPARWKLGMRFFLKGESKTQRERFKKFAKWQAKVRELEDSKEQVASLDDTLASKRWELAGEGLSSGGDPSHLKKVDLVIMDLRGSDDDLRDTLSQSEAVLPHFRSVTFVSAFEIPEELYEQCGVDAIQVETGYYDLFETLDEFPREAEDGFVCFLEAGAAMPVVPTLPDGWEEARMIVPQSLDLDTGAASEVLMRDEWIRKALFPMRIPCLMLRQDLLREDPHLFRHFMHHAFWHLFLSCVEKDPATLLQLDAASVIAPARQHNLSLYGREWLNRYDPDVVPNLRSVPEEWDMLNHDLTGRVAAAHVKMFQDQVVYLAAVAETRIRR